MPLNHQPNGQISRMAIAELNTNKRDAPRRHVELAIKSFRDVGPQTRPQLHQCTPKGTREMTYSVYIVKQNTRILALGQKEE